MTTVHHTNTPKLLKLIKIWQVVIRTKYIPSAIREPTAMVAGKMPKIVERSRINDCFQELKSGMTVVINGAAATPLSLVNAMTEVGKSKNLKNIKVAHMLTMGPAPYSEPEMRENFRVCTLFIGGNVRKAVQEGRADAIPLFLSDYPLMYYKKILQPDMTMVSLSKPDENGYCSLGTTIVGVRAAMQHSKMLVGQINKQMPRTFGDGVVHISQFDYVTTVDEPIPIYAVKNVSAEEKKTAKYITDNLVEDGATIQVGIGNIPDSVYGGLFNHKELGLHTEMFSDGIIDLIKSGCITNSKKTMFTGRIVGSFCMGTKKLYNFINDLPLIELLRGDFVNNTRVIAKQSKMTSVNTCIEIDITGQVCSDSIGSKIYSGFGGQLDFLRGAAESVDRKGKPILALLSTTKNGESKIVAALKSGAGVVTTRAHVNYVVTEYGIAELFGKNFRQRAYALIRIAHPKHREALEKGAFERLACMPSPD